GITLEGLSFYDGNFNLTRDPGEKPVQGVRLNVFDSLGVLVNSVWSDENGHFHLPPLPNGRFRVAVEPVPGLLARNSSVEIDITDSTRHTLQFPFLRTGLSRADVKINAHDISVDHNVTVFPNPASSKVNLRFRTFDETSADIRLFDSHGKQVLFSQLDGLATNELASHSIDISHVPAGIYTVKVYIGTEMYDFQLVIAD